MNGWGGIKFLLRWMGMDGSFAGMGGDGTETGSEQAGIEIKS